MKKSDRWQDILQEEGGSSSFGPGSALQASASMFSSTVLLQPWDITTDVRTTTGLQSFDITGTRSDLVRRDWESEATEAPATTQMTTSRNFERDATMYMISCHHCHETIVQEVSRMAEITSVNPDATVPRRFHCGNCGSTTVVPLPQGVLDGSIKEH